MKVTNKHWYSIINKRSNWIVDCEGDLNEQSFLDPRNIELILKKVGFAIIGNTSRNISEKMEVQGYIPFGNKDDVFLSRENTVTRVVCYYDSQKRSRLFIEGRKDLVGQTQKIILDESYDLQHPQNHQPTFETTINKKRFPKANFINIIRAIKPFNEHKKMTPSNLDTTQTSETTLYAPNKEGDHKGIYFIHINRPWLKEGPLKDARRTSEELIIKGPIKQKEKILSLEQLFGNDRMVFDEIEFF